jgi:hypothetical protein
MANPYESPSTAAVVQQGARGLFIGRIMRLMIAYLSLSIVTLPFVDELWFGEMPVLALFQFPKLNAALWLRRHVVMPVIGAIGLSQGSFSPDWSLAGPYALAITYLLPLGLILAIVWWRTRMSPPDGRIALMLAVVCLVDYGFVMAFGRGPGLSIY